MTPRWSYEKDGKTFFVYGVLAEKTEIGAAIVHPQGYFDSDRGIIVHSYDEAAITDRDGKRCVLTNARLGDGWDDPR